MAKKPFFHVSKPPIRFLKPPMTQKMLKNYKKQNFGKMSKNNVFFYVSKPPIRFPKPPMTQKMLKNDKKPKFDKKKTKMV